MPDFGFQTDPNWLRAAHMAALGMGDTSGLQALMQRRMMQQKAQQWGQEFGLQQQQFGLEKERFNALAPLYKAETHQAEAGAGEIEQKTASQRDLESKATVIGMLKSLQEQLNHPSAVGASNIMPFGATGPGLPSQAQQSMGADLMGRTVQALRGLPGMPTQFGGNQTIGTLAALVDAARKGEMESIASRSPTEVGRLEMQPMVIQSMLERLGLTQAGANQRTQEGIAARQAEGQANREQKDREFYDALEEKWRAAELGGIARVGTGTESDKQEFHDALGRLSYNPPRPGQRAPQTRRFRFDEQTKRIVPIN